MHVIRASVLLYLLVLQGQARSADRSVASLSPAVRSKGHFLHEASSVEKSTQLGVKKEIQYMGSVRQNETQDDVDVQEQDKKDRLAFVVFGFEAAVILLSLIVSMVAQTSTRKVWFFTSQAADQVINIFFAVLVFETLDTFARWVGMVPDSYVMNGSFVCAMLLQTIAVCLSYLLTGSLSNLAIFAAMSAHFVGSGFVRSAVSGLMYMGLDLHSVVAAFFALAAIVAIIYVVVYQIKRMLGLCEDDAMLQALDDLETAVGASAVAISWTILAYYTVAKGLQGLEIQDAAERERHGMFLYTSGVSFVGGLVMLCSSSLDRSRSYPMKRFTDVVASATVMCIAWAWLLYGQLFFRDHPWSDTPILGQIAFAAVSLLAASAAVVLMAALPDNAAASQAKMLFILAVAVVTGWSLEDAFVGGVEIAVPVLPAHDAGSRQHVELCKVYAALATIAVAMPIHIIYFKPMLLAKPKCMQPGMFACDV